MDGEVEREPLIMRLAGFDSHGTTRARLGSRWIEVEHGIPGETVEAEMTGSRRRPIGHIVRVLEPAPHRISPPCEYFRDWDCGGCQWQQMSYSGQLEWKRLDVDNTMRAAGLTAEIGEIHALTDPWRYRSTAGISMGKHAGFRRHGSQAIVPLHDCPISQPLIGRLMALLNQAIESEDVPDFHGRVRIDVRVAGNVNEEFLQILIRPNNAQDVLGSDVDALVHFLKTQREVKGISLLRAGGRIEIASDDEFAVTEVAGKPVFLSAASFFQTNLLLLPELIGRIQEEAGHPDRVADIYAGVGILGLFLGEKSREVVEIEADQLAIRAGELTARQWGLDNVRFVTAAAEEALEAESAFDVVIVDPPRSGLSDAVRAALVQKMPGLILYISCLAQSLARDLEGLLSTGYRLESLELFDFYPQTYHVELLAVLRHSSPVPSPDRPTSP